MAVDPFDDSIGLCKPRDATKDETKFTLRLLGVSGMPVKASTCARHSKISFSHVGDVVLYRMGGSYSAGRVLLFVEVLGHPIVILETFRLIVGVANVDNTTMWEVTGLKDFFPLQDIVDPVSWQTYEANKVRLIEPFDLKACVVN